MNRGSRISNWEISRTICPKCGRLCDIITVGEEGWWECDNCGSFDEVEEDEE